MAKFCPLVKRFCKSLKVPTGRLAGNNIKLAPCQNRPLHGAFANRINVSAWGLEGGLTSSG